MELLEKYLKVDEAKSKDLTIPAKDFLTILQALWKAETFMEQVSKGVDLDIKHWISVIRDAEKIMTKINMKR